MIGQNQSLAEVAIEQFSLDKHDMRTIAANHLAVRLRQRQDKENWTLFKADITDSQDDLSAIPQYYIEPGGNFFVAVESNSYNIVGFVGLKRQSAQVGELKRLAVLPECRGRQLGLALAKTALDWSREMGITTVELVTGIDEHAQELVYEPLGFTVRGLDAELRDIHMRLNLVDEY